VIVRTRWVIPIGRLHVNCQAAKQGSERESVRIYVPSFDNTTSSPFHFRLDLSLHSSIAAAAATHLSKKDPKLKDFPFKPHDVIIFAEIDGCIRMHFKAANNSLRRYAKAGGEARSLAKLLARD
jgi:hypothetical protein